MRAKEVIILKHVGWLLLVTFLCLLTFILQGCFSPSPQVNLPEFNVGFSICDFNYIGTGGEGERLTAAVWYPTAEKPSSFTYSNDFTSIIAYNAAPDREHGPYPLIVFNHGLYASGIQSLPLTEYLASQGFVVVAPDYSDTIAPDFVIHAALSRIRNEEKVNNLVDIVKALADSENLINASRDTLVTYLEKFRLGKAGFIIDAMLGLNEDRSSAFYNLIDGTAIGMIGHSLGGLTTLGLIGAYDDVGLKDERIKAALVLSAPEPFKEHIEQVNVPIMIMHGDIDLPSLEPEEERKALYEKADSPKFYMVIRFATHFTFGNAPCENHDSIPECQNSDEHVRVINGYASAFFKRYLKQDIEAEEELRRSNLMLAIYDKEL